MRRALNSHETKQRRGALRIAGIAGVLIAALTVVPATPAFAAHGSISGTIGESNGQSGGPVEGAIVRLDPPGDGAIQTRTTDANGAYSFETLANGTYSISVDTPPGDKPAAAISRAVTAGAHVTDANINFLPVSVAGYWIAATDGAVFAYGESKYYGGMAGKRLVSPIVGVLGTSAQLGYWLVAADGGIFAFGDAKHYGSMGGKQLNAPIVGITIDVLDGVGYYLVASDGGIFAFAAEFSGSAGSLKLNKPIVGITPDLDGEGYYLAASDGGVFAYKAIFHGSAGSLPLHKPIVGIDAASDGNGYTLIARDAGVFGYPAGGVEYYGSPCCGLLNSIVGIWTI